MGMNHGMQSGSIGRYFQIANGDTTNMVNREFRALGNAIMNGLAPHILAILLIPGHQGTPGFPPAQAVIKVFCQNVFNGPALWQTVQNIDAIPILMHFRYLRIKPLIIDFIGQNSGTAFPDHRADDADDRRPAACTPCVASPPSPDVAPRAPAAGGTRPVFAYHVQASRENVASVPRLIRAIHAPENDYLLHVDAKGIGSPGEVALRALVASEPYSRNVRIMDSAFVAYRGISMVLTTFDALVELVETSRTWTHFVYLSGSDYPLISQEQLAAALEEASRDAANKTLEVSFVSTFGALATRWKHLAVDPALWGLNLSLHEIYGSEIPFAPPLPVGYGSAYGVLSRAACEALARSREARRLLVMMGGMTEPAESFFQTFFEWTREGKELGALRALDDLRYWEQPMDSQHQKYLETQDQLAKALGSGAPFARKFAPDSKLLDQIDALSAQERAAVAVRQKSGGSRDAVPSTRSILKDQLAATEEPTFGQLRALVASGRVPLPLAIAVKLAFLAWRAEATGDQKQKIGKSVLSKVTANLPPEYRKKGKAIEKQISDDAEDVANLSPYDAVLAFFKLWRSLPASRYVWFPVKQTVQDEADAKEIWLGIGKESVCIIDGPAREIQKSYAVADLKRFAASPSQITLDFGTKGCPTYLTTEAGHMEILLAAHLEVYWRKKREAELAARQAAALLHGPASSQPDSWAHLRT
ncbi:core-2/I-branching enzyme-domain-containing protein [Hyaloraphidium curvatum]|nr:core-2/I-branching enzyme-domain-containing protein [Hyaloraphidium curvatum]